MNEMRERPFEYLRKKENGSKFKDELVRNWYIARAYILDKLSNIAYKPSSCEHLQVAVMDDSPLMLCVVRQVALSAHYINYDEDNEDESLRNRTVIILVSTNPKIKMELEKEEYLCNLPKYCRYKESNSNVLNEDSYIDIEIQVKSELSDEDKSNCSFVLTKEDVEAFCKLKEKIGEDIFSIDTRKAVYASRMYSLGAVIDNLPAEDIHCASRYVMALDVFQYSKLKEIPRPLMAECNCNNQSRVKECISNIFCSDCFESRCLSIQLCSNEDPEREKEIWGDYNRVLSKSEHARWVVEKLIMGYTPFSREQRFKDESLSYVPKKRNLYRKALKNDSKHPSHIDLCSYTDLRRINPADLKYDSFLMLAIPIILKKVREEYKR